MAPQGPHRQHRRAIAPAQPVAEERPDQRADRGPGPCLLYTSDAADERSSVDLGGRRIIKKKTTHDSSLIAAK